MAFKILLLTDKELDIIRTLIGVEITQCNDKITSSELFEIDRKLQVAWWDK